MSNGTVTRGDIVMVDVPYLDATRTVRRPALIISDTSQMLDVIIAAISSRIRDPLPKTHYVIDSSHSDWKASGLRLDSVIRCDRIFTVHHDQIHRVLGRLSESSIREIDDHMKRALGLS